MRRLYNGIKGKIILYLSKCIDPFRGTASLYKEVDSLVPLTCSPFFGPFMSFVHVNPHHDLSWLQLAKSWFIAAINHLICYCRDLSLSLEKQDLSFFLGQHTKGIQWKNQCLLFDSLTALKGNLSSNSYIHRWEKQTFVFLVTVFLFLKFPFSLLFPFSLFLL